MASVISLALIEKLQQQLFADAACGTVAIARHFVMNEVAIQIAKDFRVLDGPGWS